MVTLLLMQLSAAQASEVWAWDTGQMRRFVVSHHLDSAWVLDVGKIGQAPVRAGAVAIDAVVDCTHKGAISGGSFEAACLVEDVVVRITPLAAHAGQAEPLALDVARRLHTARVLLRIKAGGDLTSVDVDGLVGDNDPTFAAKLWEQLLGHTFKAFDASAPRATSPGAFWDEENNRTLEFALGPGGMVGASYRYTVVPGGADLTAETKATGMMTVGASTPLALQAVGRTRWAPGRGLVAHEVLVDGDPREGASRVAYSSHIGLWEVGLTDFVQLEPTGELNVLASQVAWPGYALKKTDTPTPNRWVGERTPPRGLPAAEPPPPQFVEPPLQPGQARMVFVVRPLHSLRLGEEVLGEGEHMFRGVPGPVVFTVEAPGKAATQVTVVLEEGRRTECVIDQGKATCATR